MWDSNWVLFVSRCTFCDFLLLITCTPSCLCCVYLVLYMYMLWACLTLHHLGVASISYFCCIIASDRFPYPCSLLWGLVRGNYFNGEEPLLTSLSEKLYQYHWVLDLQMSEFNLTIMNSLSVPFQSCEWVMSYSEIVVDFFHAIKLTTESILLAKKRSCSEVLSATNHR